MKLSQRLQEEGAFVERSLGDSLICNRCPATLKTYAEVCSADLAESCAGFLTIERAKADFAEGRRKP